MLNKNVESQKKQVALYLCDELNPAQRRIFEERLTVDQELQHYSKEFQTTLKITNSLKNLRPTDEFLQGNRNLLRGKIAQLDREQKTNPVWTKIKNMLQSLYTKFTHNKQPVWAVATYVMIAFFAGRLFLTNGVPESIDITSSGPIDMQSVIQSGVLSNIQIDQSRLSPSTIRLASHSDKNFNISGNISDRNIRQILYYLLLNDEDHNNRLKAGNIISRMTPDDELNMVLISSVLSETDNNVRLNSMRMLSNTQPSTNLINASKRVLLDDHNDAMRMEALKILTKTKPDDLIPLLQIVSLMDENAGVRYQAQKYLDENQSPVKIENIEVQ